MKNSRILLLLALTVFLFVLLAGCAAGEAEASRLPAEASGTQPAALQSAAIAQDAPAAVPEISQATQPSETAPVTAVLTREEALAIALEHAGFTGDQVSRLRTQYEIDDGIPQYEVEFHQDRWEYDYEIHAETGQILSFEKDD